MTIIETPVFTKRIGMILSESEYADLQSALVQDPLKGVVIAGSGGIRKLRWNIRGKGKRGGARILYYYMRTRYEIFMLFAFKKNEMSDLSKGQLEQLRAIIEEEYHETRNLR